MPFAIAKLPERRTPFVGYRSTCRIREVRAQANGPIRLRLGLVEDLQQEQERLAKAVGADIGRVAAHAQRNQVEPSLGRARPHAEFYRHCVRQSTRCQVIPDACALKPNKSRV